MSSPEPLVAAEFAFPHVVFRKDRIDLCYVATPRADPVAGFPCSPEVYVCG